MKRLILSILTLLATTSGLFAQDDISFEVAAPGAVEAGELFRIEFVINAINDVEFAPPTIEGFEVLAGPTRAVTSNFSADFNSGQMTHTEITTYTYVLQGFTAGLHTISAARATVAGKSYSTKPVEIEVVGEAGAAGGGATSGQGSRETEGGAAQGQGSVPEVSAEDAFIRAIVNRTEVYKGEPVTVTFKLYSRIAFSGIDNPKLPAFNGFWQQDITPAEPAAQRETYNNRVYDTWVLKEHLLYPQQSGSLTIDPFGVGFNAVFRISTAPRSIFDEFLGGGQNIRQVRKEIASQPVRINVRDWPEQGKPASFDGAVGEFRLEPAPPPSTMRVNTSGTYTLRLSGTGNYPTIIHAPKLSLPDSFEQFNVTTSDNTRHTRTGTGGYKEFSYSFIPRTDGLYTIPAFEFSYFDPGQKRYITLSSREISIEVTADTTAVATSGGGMISGISKEDLRVFGQDIRFIKRGGAGLREKGHTFMWSPVYISLLAFLLVLFAAGFIVLPRYVRNMQSDRFVRGKRANKVALRRFRAAETSMKRDDRHGFYDEMLKALWGYMSDKFDIPMAGLTKDRIREELFERNISEAQSAEYERIISECEEAQYSPVSSSRMGELYREGVALVSELESAIKRI